MVCPRLGMGQHDQSADRPCCVRARDQLQAYFDGASRPFQLRSGTRCPTRRPVPEVGCGTALVPASRSAPLRTYAANWPDHLGTNARIDPATPAHCNPIPILIPVPPPDRCQPPWRLLEPASQMTVRDSSASCSRSISEARAVWRMASPHVQGDPHPRVWRPGSRCSWDDVPTPVASVPGEVLIRQQAIGLNYIDIYYRTGLYKVPDASLPCLEWRRAGVVEAIGSATFTTLAPGRSRRLRRRSFGSLCDTLRVTLAADLPGTLTGRNRFSRTAAGDDVAWPDCAGAAVPGSCR